MLAPSHVVVGVLTVTFLAEKIYQPLPSYFALGFAVVGALFPNLDHKGYRPLRFTLPLLALLLLALLLLAFPPLDFTKGQVLYRTLRPLGAYLSFYDTLTLALVLLASLLSQLLLGHRRLTHSLLVALPLTLGLIYPSSIYMVIFSLAYLSHILLDLCSAYGIHLFFPFGKKIALYPRLSPGSFGEGFLVLLFILTAYLVSHEGATLLTLLQDTLLPLWPF